MTFNTVSKRYQGTGILKSDCKQPLRIGIIRALNECTGETIKQWKTRFPLFNIYTYFGHVLASSTFQCFDKENVHLECKFELIK